MKKFTWAVLVLLFTSGLALAGSDQNLAEAGPAVNVFDQHRQEWLDRDGQLPTGGYGNTNPHPGKSYIFAWIENCLQGKGNCYLENPPNDPQVGSLPEEIEELFEGIGEDIYTRSGSIHELTLARIYFQYRDVIQSWIDQGRYSDVDIIAEIEKLFKQNANKNSYMYFRRWNQSTQPIYTPIAFLWTQLRDRSAQVEFGGNNNEDVSFTSTYSGIHYQAGDGSGPLTGGTYNTYELARDWLFEAYDTWADDGAYEMDGNYAEHILSAGILLSDFAKRPEVLAQGGSLAVDAQEMAKRSRMIMELMHLDMGMDFSARQLGGNMGRNKGGHIAEGSIRWPFGVYFDLPDTYSLSDGYYRDGHHYASSYRLPELIQDAIELHDEPANYWHIQMEDNGTGGDGNWTFVTPYFNLGGSYEEGGPVGNDWVLNILSGDGSGAKEGQPFKLWIDADPDFFETAQDANRKKTVTRGKNNLYQYHNAAFLRIASGDSLHVIKGNFKFDEGETNLIDNGRGYENDYTIGSGWKFFREGKTAIAMRYLGGTAPAVWAMEVVVIDDLVTGEHVYPTYQAFKDAVEANAELSGSYFITSRGRKIEAGGVAGLVDGNEIWDTPFARMETIDHQGNQIISWQEAANIGKMTVSKHGLTCTYDFSNPKAWKTSGNGCQSGSVPQPSTFIDVPVDHWAYDEIEALYQDGYVAGCSTEPMMYCPDQIMTRAESAVFVERGIHGAGHTPSIPTVKVFEDVLLSEWFAKWVGGLWDDGYTSGCGIDPLIYCPLQEHTRTEGTVFFLRMLNGAGYAPPDAVGIFADVDLDYWGAKWIEAAYTAGLIPAFEISPQLKFCPQDPLDRAMGAYMMVQAKGIEIP
jgi:hypothetical protein